LAASLGAGRRERGVVEEVEHADRLEAALFQDRADIEPAWTTSAGFSSSTARDQRAATSAL
jgi:hypothetical protein